jgi:hypothetical protein
MWNTKSRGHIAHERRRALRRNAILSPVVDSWIEKADGDSELVLSMLDREVKNRSFEEQATLRNLVLKALQPNRDIATRQRDITIFREELKKAWDTPDRLNSIVWEVANSGDKDYFQALSAELLPAAERMCELTEYINSFQLDTLARVHFERGELEEAIRWQEEADKFSVGSNADEIKKTLEGYKSISN